MAISLRDGEPLWEVSVSTPKGRSELDRISDVDGEFAYLDGIVFAASFNGRVVAIDLDKGETLWAKDLSSYAGLSVDRERMQTTVYGAWKFLPVQLCGDRISFYIENLLHRK